jgi:hypothetical protein
MDVSSKYWLNRDAAQQGISCMVNQRVLQDYLGCCERREYYYMMLSVFYELDCCQGTEQSML